MLKFYLRDLEPLNNYFNQDVLLKETSELWPRIRDVTLAGLARGSVPGGQRDLAQRDTCLETQQQSKSSFDLHHKPACFWGQQESYGLLSVVYAILYTACDAISFPDLRAQHVFPCRDEPQLKACLLYTSDAADE